MTSKQFRGEVRIEDVKEQFDLLTSRINEMVEAYNSTENLNEIDYTIGGTNLSPNNYTLTLGGLKQILNIYEDVILGCKPFKVNDSTIKVTSGIYLSPTGCKRIPEAVLVNSGNADVLNYDLDNNKLAIGNKSSVATSVEEGGFPSQSQITSNDGSFGSISATTDAGNAYLPLGNKGTWTIMPNLMNFNARQNNYLYWNLKGTGLSDGGNVTVTFGVGQDNVTQSALKALMSTGKFYASCYIKFDNGAWNTMNTSWDENITFTSRYEIPLGTTFKSVKIALFSWHHSNVNNTDSGLRVRVSNIKFTGMKVGSTTYTDTKTGNRLLKICDLNWNRNSSIIDDRRNVMCEDLPFNYKITTTTNNVDYNQGTQSGVNDTSISRFVTGLTGRVIEGTGRPLVYLFGKLVGWHQQSGHKNAKYAELFSMLFIPKGIASPFTNTIKSANRFWSVNVTKS